MGESKEAYNDIPVFYCKNCLSLRVESVPGMEELDYCDECGTTDIGKCHIEEWRQKYKSRFGFDYLDKY